MPDQLSSTPSATSAAGERGFFIVIEGIDGAGTTTQTERLADYLVGLGRRAEITSEPTRGPFGCVIRQVIEKRIETSSNALAAAFASDRLDHYYNRANGILQHIERGVDVISDRYVMSSLAYQGLDCDRDWLLQINSQAPAPDLTIFVRVTPDEAWRRIDKRSTTEELFHVPEKLTKVAANYEEALALDHPNTNAVVIDGNRDVAEVHGEIREIVDKLLRG